MKQQLLTSEAETIRMRSKTTERPETIGQFQTNSETANQMIAFGDWSPSAI